MVNGVVATSKGWLKAATKPVEVIVQELTIKVVLKAADLAAVRLPSLAVSV